MNALATLAAVVAEGPVGVTQNTGEQVTFWVCATLAVIGAGGTVLSRKAVHSALFIALTMINLAVLYVAQDAPFLGMVQVIVYTGAVMMLFVFVLMVVGVDASDSLVETLKGQRALAGLAFVGFLQPHTYAGDLARQFPVYKVLFAATVIGTVFTRDRQLPPRDWRVLVLAALWLLFFLTTAFSWLPVLAWPRFVEVSAVLASTFLVLVLINAREKLLVLIAAIALAFGLVSLKGGFWAVIHGFAERVYGPPGSQYGDNNHFAVAAVMTVPLLLLWFRQSAAPWLKAALALTLVLSVFAALSSWSRGATPRRWCWCPPPPGLPVMHPGPRR